MLAGWLGSTAMVSMLACAIDVELDVYTFKEPVLGRMYVRHLF